MCRCPGTGGAMLMITSPPPSSTSSLSLGFQAPCTMEPRGIFSMAVSAEVLAAALAEDGSRRSRPGAVPDYCFTVDGRRMLYDVKRISFCPTRYWPTVAVASSRGGALEYRASLVRTEYEAAASALDARTAAWYIRTGTAVPVGAPTAVDILASFPPVRGLVFGSTACGVQLQGGRRPPCSGCVVVSPASVALARRPLHARRAVLHDLDATLSGRLRRGRRSRPSPPLAS